MIQKREWVIEPIPAFYLYAIGISLRLINLSFIYFRPTITFKTAGA